jgi:hypothetical protein
VEKRLARRKKSNKMDGEGDICEKVDVNVDSARRELGAVFQDVINVLVEKVFLFLSQFLSRLLAKNRLAPTSPSNDILDEGRMNGKNGNVVLAVRESAAGFNFSFGDAYDPSWIMRRKRTRKYCHLYLLEMCTHHYTPTHSDYVICSYTNCKQTRVVSIARGK